MLGWTKRCAIAPVLNKRARRVTHKQFGIGKARCVKILIDMAIVLIKISLSCPKNKGEIVE